MTVGAMILGLALLVLIASIVLRPLTARARRDGVLPEPRQQPHLEHVLAALRDLDFDHQMGRVSGEDYTPARAGLLAKAAQAIDQHQESSVEDMLEARVKEIRRRLDEDAPAASCAHCGGRLLPEDRFCTRCGDPQTGACPFCGGSAGSEDRYCVECGCQLHAKATPTPPGP